MSKIAKIKALKHQREFINSKTKFTGLVAGYGAGKTEAMIFKTLNFIFNHTGSSIANYCPSYPLIRDIFFPKYKKYLSALGINVQFHTTSKEIIFPNGSRIIMRTLDNPEYIVGYEVSDSLIDEIDVMPKIKAQVAVEKIIARNRQKKSNGESNTISFTSTPEGFEFMYDFFVTKKNDTKTLIKARTQDNPFLPLDYVETLKNTYDARLLEAYLEGNFINLKHGNVYYAFDRAKHVVEKIILDTTQPIYLTCDFNISPMSWLLLQKINGEVFIFKEFIKNNTNTQEMINIISEFLNGICEHVIVHGDFFGNSRSTSSSQTDYMIIRETLANYFKVDLSVPSSQPAVKDRINSVNRMLEKHPVKIDASCVTLISDLEQVSWDHKGNIDKSNQTLTHSSDALGYWSIYYFGFRDFMSKRKSVLL